MIEKEKGQEKNRKRKTWNTNVALSFQLMECPNGLFRVAQLKYKSQHLIWREFSRIPDKVFRDFHQCCQTFSYIASSDV